MEFEIILRRGAKRSSRCQPELQELLKKNKNAKVKEAVASLVGQIADLKLDIAGLKEQLATIMLENQQLNAQLLSSAESGVARSNVDIRDKVLWLKELVEGYGEGPYCPNCFELTGKLIAVHDMRGTPLGRVVKFSCEQCDSHF